MIVIDVNKCKWNANKLDENNQNDTTVYTKDNDWWLYIWDPIKGTMIFTRSGSVGCSIYEMSIKLQIKFGAAG